MIRTFYELIVLYEPESLGVIIVIIVLENKTPA